MLSSDSPAVAVARAHVEAWSRHDWDAARAALAPEVTATASTLDGLPPASVAGVDKYMQGLIDFAQPVVPGSLRVIGSAGDERNALLMVTARMSGGPFGAGAAHAGARLYQLDDDGKIKGEQVIFHFTPD
jgi:hypothetical protein